MATPKPGRPVRGSTSGRAINALLDLLGRRMAMRILWQLSFEPLSFRALEVAAGTNPSLLNTRLRELRDAALVDHEAGTGYTLTRQGRELITALGPLVVWSDRWKPHS